jgi:hypothetical protein
MPLVVSTPPASEPITVEEVRRYCRIDGTNAEPAPWAFTAALASPAAPGNVDNGAHRWLATFVTLDGETEAGAPSAPVTVVDKTVNGQVQLSGIPVGGAAVTARKIYRMPVAGGAYLYAGTIADNVTTTFTDNLADAGLGAGAPTTNTTEDPLLSLFIASARAHAQQELGRFLITQTVDLFLDAFPYAVRFPQALNAARYDTQYDSRFGYSQPIKLPPLQSVTSITYVDSSGTVGVVLDPAQYIVDAASIPARIAPAFNTAWPAARCQANAIRVRFVAGYGVAAAVPACIKQWMMLRVKTLWENREQLSASETRAVLLQLPDSYVDGLLDSERVPTI